MDGKTLGNYEILDKLGEGGMGEVWRARDRRLQRFVAVKILPPDVAADPTRRARFEQEARALGALNHPHIVAIYDFGEDGGRAYLVSEMVDGESLRALLDRGPLPVRKATEIAGQMAEGIAAAHALGIVHRDLKPENVMLTRGGQVKLLDFGLAKQTAPAAGENTATMALSMPGTVMGTVGYMSPEQVRGETVDARSDIFSFGCVLYEMFTGKRAFQAATGVETMHAILNADPPEFEVDAAKLPPALTIIGRRCLEKRPEQRFQSAADLAFALRSVSGVSVTGAQTVVAPGPAKSRRRWWPAVAIVGALALVALGFFLRDRTLHRGEARFQRISFRRGYVNAARFAPDGRNVVYEASWEGGASHIYLAVAGSPESRDLEMPAESSLAAVSSQQELALMSPPFGEYATGRLVRSSISGGQTRPLLDGVLAADWGPDGASLAVLRRVDGVNRLEYPIGTVIAGRIGWPLWMVRVSPDGQRVAYATRTNGTAIGLTVVDRTGKKNFLGAVSGQNGTGENASLSWNPKGSEIWFRSFDPAEPGIVYAVDLKGRRRVALALPSRVKLYDIARNGDVLLSTGSGQLGILGQAPGATAERDLSCLDSGQVAGISDDGRVIAANITGESGGDKGTVYLRKTDGSAAIRLGDGHVYGLSPDGNWTSGYALNADGSRRFVLQPTGPGEDVQVKVPGLDASIVYGWLEGDRRYLVGGHAAGKKWQCFIWDAGRGSVQPLCPEESPDSLAYYVSPDRKLVLLPGRDGWLVYPIDGEPSREVHGMQSNEAVIGWREDNRSVYVRPGAENTDSISVSIVEIAGGKRTPWKVIHPSQPVLEIHDLHVTPDGRAYAYNYVTAQSDLYIAHGLN